MILIKKVSTFTLLKLILGYRAGKHFDGNGVSDRFKQYVIYRKCQKINISNIKKICSDGEIFDITDANISVINNAIRYI